MGKHIVNSFLTANTSNAFFANENSTGHLLPSCGGAMYLQVKCHPNTENQTQSHQQQCDRR